MLTELKNREVKAEIELSGREVMVCIQMWTSTPINSEGIIGLVNKHAGHYSCTLAAMEVTVPKTTARQEEKLS